MPGVSVAYLFLQRLIHSLNVRSAAATGVLSFTLAMLACTGSMPNTVPETTSQLRKAVWQGASRISRHFVITPADPTLQSGQQVWFKATQTNSDVAPVQRTSVETGSGGSMVPVKWTTTAGTISEKGLFTAPSVQGPQSVTITATSMSHPVVQATTTVMVSAVGNAHSGSAPTITTTDLPPASSGEAYTASLSVSGGKAPYAWSIVLGPLPSGLSLDSKTGTISGSTVQEGSFSVTIQVMDASGASDARSFALTVAARSNSGACGPPTYPCSRTDLQVAPLPNLTPNVGNLTGANTVITDPDFHNPIVRLTDANTNPHAKNVTFVASAGGSSNANTWNSDSTLVFVQDTNSTGYPMTFNPATLEAARMYISSFPQTGGFTTPQSHFSWSRTNPNYLYVLGGTKILLYDFTNRNQPPSPRLVYDFTSSQNCLARGFSPTWLNFGGISAGDTNFVVGLSNTGFQGTGTDVVVYTVGKGCTHLNTQTGQVTSDWGQAGTITTSDRFTLHDSFSTLSSGWVILGSTTCLSSTCARGPYFWQVGTTNVTACVAGQLCGGHWTVGHYHWANNDGDPTQGQYHMRPFSDLNAFSPIISALPPGLAPGTDQHPSWNNADANDSVPFVSSSWTRMTPFTAAWQNEIMAISPTANNVTRFAHNFITAYSHRFDDKEAIGQVSQDGRFFIFSSDWMGTLGSESGSSTCTIGTDCRGDVFVVQLN
jgi:putative Ig domain-containing protein